MDQRQLGDSGLFVPALSFGTGTFGGTNDMFAKWGKVDVKGATRLVDLCLEAGVNLFDTADVYSDGAAEEILGKAVAGRRNQVLISSKAGMPTGPGLNDFGTSRHHLVSACESTLRRLGTDHVDLYYMHAFDALTPVEETLRALDDLIRAGKVRYIGCSNFSGWHVMKSLATSERFGLGRYVAYQGYYSLLHRDYEWELMPLALDQGLGTVVWSPLGWGRLTGKITREVSVGTGRIQSGGAAYGPEVDDGVLFDVVDALKAVAEELGKTVPQVALNWLLQRPTVASVVIGARDEVQLRDNLAAVGWELSPEHTAKLEAAHQRTPIYPYWHQRPFAARNPQPTRW